MFGDMLLLAAEMLASLWGAGLVIVLLAVFAGIHWYWSPGAVFRIMIFTSCGVLFTGFAGAGQIAWVASNMVFVPPIVVATIVAALTAILLGAAGVIPSRR
ncbi:MAG: hypothetical protein AAGE80_11475 [Pseudomonadota bacterium]